jgi:hypothetical protein
MRVRAVCGSRTFVPKRRCVCVCVCVCRRVYIYTYIYSVCICVRAVCGPRTFVPKRRSVCVCVCVCVRVYIYIHIVNVYACARSVWATDVRTQKEEHSDETTVRGIPNPTRKSQRDSKYSMHCSTDIRLCARHLYYGRRRFGRAIEGRAGKKSKKERTKGEIENDRMNE